MGFHCRHIFSSSSVLWWIKAAAGLGPGGVGSTAYAKCSRSIATSSILATVNTQTRRRAAALLEVLGVYLAGTVLENKIEQLLVHWRLISTTNPFDLMTDHATNAELLVASRQLLLALILMYSSYFLLILSHQLVVSTARARGLWPDPGGALMESADPGWARNRCFDAVAGVDPYTG
jgi:hypothetical protein